MAWLYVPELAVSNSDSESSGLDFAPFVTLSGKVMRRQISWRGWAGRPWIQHLSGTISRPSTASRGVIAFLASLGVSRASHSVWPESVEDSQMSGGLATISSGWSMKFDPESSSWKTSQVSLFTDSPASSEDWKILSRGGGVRNGCAYPRAPWVPRTEEKDSSDFSWPTPTARDWKDGACENQDVESNALLGRVAVRWPTGPQGLPTQTAGESGSPQEARRQRLNPAFVEALMGLPPGWSLPTIGCGASATQLWLSRQRQRLASLLGV